jgi:hypothetical protein
MTIRQAAVRTLQILHYAILGWGILGWLIPSNGWLIAYLVAMPLIALQWLVNRNTCVLNNVESWIATGRWRDEASAEQGGFIAGIVQRISGWSPSPRMVDLISYGLLAVFWTFGAFHLLTRY